MFCVVAALLVAAPQNVLPVWVQPALPALPRPRPASFSTISSSPGREADDEGVLN